MTWPDLRHRGTRLRDCPISRRVSFGMAQLSQEPPTGSREKKNRNPNSETRKKSEARRPDGNGSEPQSESGSFRDSDFGFPSVLGFRISDFGLPPLTAPSAAGPRRP